MRLRIDPTVNCRCRSPTVRQSSSFRRLRHLLGHLLLTDVPQTLVVVYFAARSRQTSVADDLTHGCSRGQGGKG